MEQRALLAAAEEDYRRRAYLCIQAVAGQGPWQEDGAA